MVARTVSMRPMYCIVRSDSSSIETARGSPTVAALRSTTSVRITCMPRMLASVRPVGPAPTMRTSMSVFVMASAPHDRGAPQVQRALFVRPDARRPFGFATFELGRDLDQVVVGILDHEKEIVAGAVATDAPVQRHARGR